MLRANTDKLVLAAGDRWLSSYLYKHKMALNVVILLPEEARLEWIGWRR